MILERNLAIYKQRYPQIILDNQKISDDFQIIPSKSGDLTATYKGLYIHSRHNPKREATKQVSLINEADLFVLGGFGLGYICEELIQKYPDKPIVIFEPDINLFYEVIKVKDISNILTNSNVHFIINGSYSLIKNFFIPQKIKRIEYIPLQNRIQADSEYFSNLKETINIYLERMRVNKNTLTKFGKLWVKNQCKNIIHMGYENDISHIFNKFNDIPGIIVSAGPSMELIIPYLKELKERFLILAVDTAFKSLLEEGIEPDFVMSIDSQYWNSRHLDGSDSSKTILIADSSIQPSAIRPFNNRVFFTKSSFPLGTYFENARAPFPKIASGGSVSTNIWDFAHKLGLKEIYFIGQDLGFPGNITHYKNSYFEKNMLNNSTKINSIENQSFKYIYSGYPSYVTSNSGSKILSDKRMDIYIKWFKEKLNIGRYTNCFNLSPDGCKIEGMEYKDIAPLVSYKNVRQDINSILESLTTDKPNYYLPSILSHATTFKDALLDVTENAKRAFDLSRVIETKYLKKLNLSKELQELDDLDNAIINSKYSQTLSFIIEPFINSISESDNKNPFEALKTSQSLYIKLYNTGNLHIKHINQSIKKLKKILK